MTAVVQANGVKQAIYITISQCGCHVFGCIQYLYLLYLLVRLKMCFFWQIIPVSLPKCLWGSGTCNRFSLSALSLLEAERESWIWFLTGLASTSIQLNVWSQWGGFLCLCEIIFKINMTAPTTWQHKSFCSVRYRLRSTKTTCTTKFYAKQLTK